MHKYVLAMCYSYENDEEKEELKTFCKLWKKFFIDRSELKFIQEYWIERPPWFPLYGTIALKVFVEHQNELYARSIPHSLFSAIT